MTRNKALSMLLALLLAFSMCMPMTAYADEIAPDGPDAPAETVVAGTPEPDAGDGADAPGASDTATIQEPEEAPIPDPVDEVGEVLPPVYHAPQRTLTASLPSIDMPVDYTITCVDMSTGMPIRDTVTVSGHNCNETVVVAAPEIEGYTPCEWEKEITLSIFGDVSNDVVFYYMPRTDLSYEVRYVEANTCMLLVGPQIYFGMTFGDVICVSATVPPGYELAPWVSDMQNVTIGLDHNEVVFECVPISDLSYTVRCVSVNGDQLMPSQRRDGCRFGETVLVTAPTLSGYTITGKEVQGVTIGLDDNEVTFVYSADFSNVRVFGYSGTYDGLPHSIMVSGTLPTDTAAFSVNGVNVPNSFKDACSLFVNVTINRNGETTTKRASVNIAKAPLSVATNTAWKTFDGTPLTAGGQVLGLVNDETLTLDITGSQTFWGTSDNTYQIVWDGTANPKNYRLAGEAIGTLTVEMLPVPETNDPALAAPIDPEPIEAPEMIEDIVTVSDDAMAPVAVIPAAHAYAPVVTAGFNIAAGTEPEEAYETIDKSQEQRQETDRASMATIADEKAPLVEAPMASDHLPFYIAGMLLVIIALLMAAWRRGRWTVMSDNLPAAWHWQTLVKARRDERSIEAALYDFEVPVIPGYTATHRVIDPDEHIVTYFYAAK